MLLLSSLTLGLAVYVRVCRLKAFPSLYETFMIRDGATWRPPAVNETCCRRPRLAATLQKVAAGGPDVIYTAQAAQVLLTSRHLVTPRIHAVGCSHTHQQWPLSLSLKTCEGTSFAAGEGLAARVAARLCVACWRPGTKLQRLVQFTLQTPQIDHAICKPANLLSVDGSCMRMDAMGCCFML